jgi:hypothetical protein
MFLSLINLMINKYASYITVLQCRNTAACKHPTEREKWDVYIKNKSLKPSVWYMYHQVFRIQKITFCLYNIFVCRVIVTESEVFFPANTNHQNGNFLR